jgi:transposase-like protein
MNYSYIPQKRIIKEVIYSDIQLCPNCNSNNSFPIMNMVGSPRYCNDCNYTFNPLISGYKEVIVEK